MTSSHVLLRNFTFLTPRSTTNSSTRCYSSYPISVFEKQTRPHSRISNPKPRHSAAHIGRRSVQARPMSSATQIHWSEGSNVSELSPRLTELTAPKGRWSVTSDGKGLERMFKFKTFKAAWTFMNDMAAQCKTRKHHPEWSNVYNTVFVRWTTHNPSGLSSKDVDLARICDEHAAREESKEVESGPGETSDGLREVVGKVTGGEDCCKPR